MENGVHIIGVSSCGEEVCAAAGRISTQQGTALEIFARSHDADKNKRLIEKVTASGHTSTVEHLFFNLAFNPVFNALKKAAPSFFSFLVALIKTFAAALVNAVKSVI